jgi:hypothetical protein
MTHGYEGAAFASGRTPFQAESSPLVPPIRLLKKRHLSPFCPKIFQSFGHESLKLTKPKALFNVWEDLLK